MLGFSGHFSTKSRSYSATLGALRASWAVYQSEQAIAAGLIPDLDGYTGRPPSCRRRPPGATPTTITLRVYAHVRTGGRYRSLYAAR